MSALPDDDRELRSPEDMAFVRRIADAYAPAPLTPARRAAFDAELETRLARDRWRFAPWAAAVATAGAATLLLLARLPAAPVEQARVLEDPGADEAFVLAIAGGTTTEFDSALPADYQAIAGLLDAE